MQEPLKDRVEKLEVQLSAYELLLRTALAKLYASHEDFAAELEAIIGHEAFPRGWSDRMTREQEARVQHIHEMAWKCMKRVREDALPFESEWKTTEADLPRPQLSPTARQRSERAPAADARPAARFRPEDF
ncbi:hypothetical protein [Mesorhizobium sp. J428]|uniref:hypothetical protein n=1 Tax=Mesorhizobium sp. J428 TaxID=2898440 RepID=UPI002150B72C|nr:hypothetical protein [Mesorhizobium sp. J428]MCR5855954.1 hypothetical protein [Mesorhizobium sp. J428]